MKMARFEVSRPSRGWPACRRVGALALWAVTAALLTAPAHAQSTMPTPAEPASPAPIATPDSPAATAPVAETAAPADPELGRRTYTSYCARCHGINLVMTGNSFDLRRFPADDKARFLHSVKGGKNAMPAWGSILKPQQIESVWAYIGQVNGWPGAR